MNFNEAKRQYIINKFPEAAVFFNKPTKTILQIPCEICEKKCKCSLTISKNLKVSYLAGGTGNFHHTNGKSDDHRPENIQFLCKPCHRNFHRWGIIRRWMIKNNLKFEDLPQEDLKAWMPIY